jgi:small subunit ribosomal protein S8
MSDFIARVNNAKTAQNPSTDVLKNKLITAVVTKLTKLGYFESYSSEENGNTISVVLTPKITKLKVISKPGQRVYVKSTEYPKVQGGFGYNLVSTSQGVMTGNEAKKLNLGGEILFQIY